MARIFITGSTDGLGRAAARSLIDRGHEVLLHARSPQRATALADLSGEAIGVVTGDLRSAVETKALAEAVNRAGRMDAVIHNAGVWSGRAVLPVNIVAPYVLTATLQRPDRLVYLSSGMSMGGRPRLDGVDWAGARTDGSYSDSKLYVATLAAAIARLWPDVTSNAVDPGWVPTRMGGPSAPDDLRLGHLTQEWLATSDDPEALTSGGYWFHQRRRDPHPSVPDEQFQDRLLAALAEHTGVALQP